jgi:hypothetical protein
MNYLFFKLKLNGILVYSNIQFVYSTQTLHKLTMPRDYVKKKITNSRETYYTFYYVFTKTYDTLLLRI